MSIFECHVCGSFAQKYESRVLSSNVSSDGKIVNKPFELGVCNACGIVIKNTDLEYTKNIKKIYDDYEIYAISGGNEKRIFSNAGNYVSSRSDVLVSEINKVDPFQKKETVLDIGSGTGAFLEAWSRFDPLAKLFAHDLTEDYLARLRNIPNFQSLYSCPIHKISKKFDVISLVHVLEHIINPIQFLNQLKSLMYSNSILLVNVPNFIETPTDICVYDHCSHFTTSSINNLLKVAGFEVLKYSDKLISREHIILARKTNTITSFPAQVKHNDKEFPFYLRCLEAIAKGVEEHVIGDASHIFGTSTSSIWAAIFAKQWQGFFLDEDRNRIGKKLIFRKIIAPSELNTPTNVFLPFGEKQACQIASRLGIYGTCYFFVRYDLNKEDFVISDYLNRVY